MDSSEFSEALRYMRHSEGKFTPAPTVDLVDAISRDISKDEVPPVPALPKQEEAATITTTEATEEAVAKDGKDQKKAGDQEVGDSARPNTRGSDAVTTRHNRNFLNNILHTVFARWLGGFGRFFIGIFARKSPKPTPPPATQT